MAHRPRDTYGSRLTAKLLRDVAMNCVAWHDRRQLNLRHRDLHLLFPRYGCRSPRAFARLGDLRSQSADRLDCPRLGGCAGVGMHEYGPQSRGMITASIIIVVVLLVALLWRLGGVILDW